MAWFDNMLFEEIEQHLVERTAPGSDVPGGFVEVPNGYLRWMGNRLKAADGLFNELRIGVTVGDERMPFARAFRRLLFELTKAQEASSPTLREREQQIASKKAVGEARIQWEVEHASAVSSLAAEIDNLKRIAADALTEKLTERGALVAEIKRLHARGTEQYEGHETDAAEEGFREALDAVLDFLKAHDEAPTTSPSTTSSESGS